MASPPRTPSGRQLPEIISDVNALVGIIRNLEPHRLDEARIAARTHQFRLTRFYAENVLSGDANDPLLSLVLPSAKEVRSLAETWDRNQAEEWRIVDQPLFVQKYRHEALIRLTTQCSAYCRYCYIHEQTARRDPASSGFIAATFESLSKPAAADLREVILSGGDPLMVAPKTLSIVGSSLRTCNERRASRGMKPLCLAVHTREPIWRPNYFLDRWSDFEAAFATLGAYAYVFQIVHPREITPEFEELCLRIARAGSRSPLLLVQHPLFRGVNDSVKVLSELYLRLATAPAAVKPYYIVHPFDSGTLPEHRLSLPDSQRILQELHRFPGIQTPTLVVPTPMGKCYVAPYQPLVQGSSPGYWELRTKNGDVVDYRDLALLPVE